MDRKEGFEMDGIGEDLFFLSNGHISILQRFSTFWIFSSC
jgi:hypothetical protein